MKYRCTVCDYVYDEEAEGTPFKDLPDDWVCPVCNASKEDFEPVSLVEESMLPDVCCCFTTYNN